MSIVTMYQCLSIICPNDMRNNNKNILNWTELHYKNPFYMYYHGNYNLWMKKWQPWQQRYIWSSVKLGFFNPTVRLRCWKMTSFWVQFKKLIREYWAIIVVARWFTRWFLHLNITPWYMFTITQCSLKSWCYHLFPH